MPNIRPFKQFKFMDDGDMTAHVVGTKTDCQFHENINYDFSYTVTGVPVGVLSVQVCNSGLDADFVDYPLLAAMFTKVTGDGALNGNGTIDISGVGAGRILININDPFGFVRPKYTFTSDGTGALINCIGGAK